MLSGGILAPVPTCDTKTEKPWTPTDGLNLPPEWNGVDETGPAAFL